MIAICATGGAEEVLKFLEDIATACEAGLGLEPLNNENREQIKSLLSFASISICQIRHQKIMENK